MRKGSEGVDIQEVRGDLAERFPLWTERIRLLRFQSSDAVTLTDNDGAVIYYNDDAMLLYGTAAAAPAAGSLRPPG